LTSGISALRLRVPALISRRSLINLYFPIFASTSRPYAAEIRLSLLKTPKAKEIVQFIGIQSFE
jgi:hypothetical protein